MFNYMTPLNGIATQGVAVKHRTFSAEGHDLPSLLYHWLDELLFGFSTDFFVASSLRIVNFDREKWQIEAEARGEIFDRTHHACGTEIKAITYSAMQINEMSGDAEVFVIVDI
jgi:SHS2 domain-containing protein